MNTRKLFFGFLAVAFLAMTAVSTTIIVEDDLDDSTNIKRGTVIRE
ncbi:hypothetical protein MTsPCn9_07350 [Croceitalea sp. MTPC9]|nr:hypothetical protein MTsPCn6_01360 [Croceitalea sp. MTPC6]GMN15799.1 hypothetical protein MTsPCn9_07350 [Croceitalea sp. MTPC9]